MKTRGNAYRRWLRWLVTPIVFLAFVAGVVVLLLWLAGKFTPKVPAAARAPDGPRTRPVPGQIVKASMLKVPMSESAVGTIRAVHETTIASRILARVLEVNLKAGQAVKADQVLVRLDDVDLRARLQQAKAAVASAEAAHAQAIIDEERLREVVKTGAASRVEYDKAALALKSTAADATRSKESVNEVQAMLDYATVKSPMDGIVIDKKVDVGDTVMPGQVLVTLIDPKRMQLIASVRESLAHKLERGQSIGVKIDLLDKLCDGTISEIVPEAHSASRSFQVKVTGPCPPGIYTGMFGRIIIPLGEEQVLVIPAKAVRNIGQLEMVDVVENGRTDLRAIRTGRQFDDHVQVLSGLREGEQVVVPPPGTSATTQEASHG
ncbi:MAG: efflux RND transporter periplasmic adaptor subunit [Planctomycetota bacterium]|nr:efflux RND transporter periplasmic adaptor subunit [Planctomycetota bacterium]